MSIGENGLIIYGIKYLVLMNPNLNKLKEKSLNDRVYFTLRDIFRNGDNYNIIDIANEFNDKLTGGIYFEERNNNFEYTKILEDIIYLNDLIQWLSKIDENYFEFREVLEEDKHNIDMRCYIKYEDWKTELDKLITELELQKYSNFS